MDNKKHRFTRAALIKITNVSITRIPKRGL